jgi:hypothetical protein
MRKILWGLFCCSLCLTVSAQQDTTTTVDSASPPWYTTLRNAPPLKANVRRVPPKHVSGDRKDDDFWYVDVGPGQPKPVKIEDNPHKNKFWEAFWRSLDKPWVAFLFWTFLAGLLVAAIVFFIQSGSGESWFTSRRKRKKRLTQTETDVELKTDLGQALREAIQREDYREAIHLLFLQTLIALEARNLIHLFKDKTNREYFRELNGNPLQSDFARLLRHYEYSYFGGFAPDGETFRILHDQYTQFQNRLNTL